MDLGKVKVSIKNIGTRSDDYLNGFQDGVQALIDAAKEQALDKLPIITKEEGLRMRTGQPTPDKS